MLWILLGIWCRIFIVNYNPKTQKFAFNNISHIHCFLLPPWITMDDISTGIATHWRCFSSSSSLKMEDSVCHHDKFGYCKFKDQSKLCKNKHPKIMKGSIDKSCRFGRGCAYLHPDHSGEGNRTITDNTKAELDNLRKATKEWTHQLKATAQHPTAKMFTLETKLTHY